MQIFISKADIHLIFLSKREGEILLREVNLYSQYFLGFTNINQNLDPIKLSESHKKSNGGEKIHRLAMV